MSLDHDSTAERISPAEALSFAKELIRRWDFDGMSEAATAYFLTHVAHWATEVFGQLDGSGEWQLLPDDPQGEGIGYNELPEDLQTITMVER